MKEIVLEIRPEDAQYLAEIPEKDITILETNKFNGHSEIYIALISLAGTTVGVVGKVIIEMLRAKKNIKLKIDGIEVHGISEKNVINILNNANAKSET